MSSTTLLPSKKNQLGVLYYIYIKNSNSVSRVKQKCYLQLDFTLISFPQQKKQKPVKWGERKRRMSASMWMHSKLDRFISFYLKMSKAIVLHRYIRPRRLVTIKKPKDKNGTWLLHYRFSQWLIFYDAQAKLFTNSNRSFHK